MTTTAEAISSIESKTATAGHVFVFSLVGSDGKPVFFHAAKSPHNWLQDRIWSAKLPDCSHVEQFIFNALKKHEHFSLHYYTAVKREKAAEYVRRLYHVYSHSDLAVIENKAA